MFVIFASCTVVSSTLPTSSLIYKHIDSIVIKIIKNVGLIAKLRHFVPWPLLLTIYLTYGLAALGRECKT